MTYYGLRDYSIPPTIWGGDPACAHHFQMETKTADLRTGLGMAALGERYRGGDHKVGTVPSISVQHGFCRCGAWLGALGREPRLDMYVEHMVDVFRAVHRVLRSDGTLWLNLGSGYQNKQLDGAPWRVAFALQADGWILRQDIIFSKPNPMPESVTDRCTKSHEYIFMLTKSPRYFFDAEAIKEDASPATHARISQNLAAQVGSFRANGGNKTNGPMKAVMAGSTRKIAEAGSRVANNRSYEAALALVVEKRNRRSVWEVATQPFALAHFATFPPALVEPCILAGTSAKGCCAKCGAPWERIIEHGPADKETTRGKQPWAAETGQRDNAGGLPSKPAITLGWRPTCKCEAAVVPCAVLDPFFGSGTTGLVSDRLQRDCIGIELNPAYVTMAHNRITNDATLFAQVDASSRGDERRHT